MVDHFLPKILPTAALLRSVVPLVIVNPKGLERVEIYLGTGFDNELSDKSRSVRHSLHLFVCRS